MSSLLCLRRLGLRVVVTSVFIAVSEEVRIEGGGTSVFIAVSEEVRSSLRVVGGTSVFIAVSEEVRIEGGGTSVFIAVSEEVRIEGGGY